MEWQLRSAQTDAKAMWDKTQSLSLGLRREAAVRKCVGRAHKGLLDLSRCQSSVTDLESAWLSWCPG